MQERKQAAKVRALGVPALEPPQWNSCIDTYIAHYDTYAKTCERFKDPVVMIEFPWVNRFASYDEYVEAYEKIRNLHSKWSKVARAKGNEAPQIETISSSDAPTNNLRDELTKTRIEVMKFGMQERARRHAKTNTRVRELHYDGEKLVQERTTTVDLSEQTNPERIREYDNSSQPALGARPRGKGRVSHDPKHASHTPTLPKATLPQLPPKPKPEEPQWQKNKYIKCNGCGMANEFCLC